MKIRGFTVPEVLLSAGLLLLLGVLLMAGWAKAVAAWKTVQQKNEIVSQAQRFIRLLEHELEASSTSSVETVSSPPVLSFASTFDQDNRRDFVADSVSGALNWQKQVVYYHRSDSSEMWRRELSVSSAQTAYAMPTHLSAIDFGSGRRPLGFYATDGQPVAREIESVEFEQSKLELVMKLTVKAPSGVTASFVSTTVPRNS
ncbi:MAG: hypothetical protein WC314_15275 [Vulcanimicrobiota bacterium]